MSAFIVSNTHINALLSYAIDKQVTYWNEKAGERTRITRHNAEEVGRILMDENVRSVCARYRDAGNDEKSAGADYSFQYFSTPLTAAEVIKACQCLEYQSCETDDYDASLAWRITQDIKNHACHHVPGYDAAPWEINERSAKELKHAGAILLSTLARRR